MNCVEFGFDRSRGFGSARDQFRPIIDRPTHPYNIIIGKKLLSLKPVLRTRRSYKRAGLTKRQKSFKGLVMYGHEVFDVLTKASKVTRDTLSE
jgi:hypothetical protein